MGATLDGKMRCSNRGHDVLISSCLACPEQETCKRGREVKKEFGGKVLKGEAPKFPETSPPFGRALTPDPGKGEKKSCRIPGCKKPVWSTGFCSTHYSWRYTHVGKAQLAKLGIKIEVKGKKTKPQKAPKPAGKKIQAPVSLENQPYFFIFLERVAPVKVNRAEEVRNWLNAHPDFKGRIFRGKEMKYSTRVMITLDSIK